MLLKKGWVGIFLIFFPLMGRAAQVVAVASWGVDTSGDGDQVTGADGPVHYAIASGNLALGQITSEATTDFQTITLEATANWAIAGGSGAHFSNVAYGGATGQVSDSFIFSGGAGQGFFSMKYRILGSDSLSFTGDPSLNRAEVRLAVYQNNMVIEQIIDRSDAPGTFDLNTPLLMPAQSFTFGDVTNFSYKFVLQSFANASAVGTGGSAFSTAHFTLELLGMEVRDLSNNLITDYTVSSVSGTNYAVPVPEPSTYALFMGLGLGVLAFRRYFRSPVRR